MIAKLYRPTNMQEEYNAELRSRYMRGLLFGVSVTLNLILLAIIWKSL